MKILLVNDYLDMMGGTEKFMKELGDGLSKCNNEIYLFGHKGKEDFISLFSRFYSFKWRKEIKEKIDIVKPDIIHLNNFTRILSPSIIKPCIESGAKVVITLHDFYNFSSTNILGKLKRDILKKVLKKYKDKITFVSASQILADKMSSYLDVDVKVINNGVEIPEKPTIYDGSIFYVGALNKEKGFHIIEGRMNRLRKRKFHKVTNFETKPEVFYKKSSILVFPSIVKENFPYVILEAMSYGLCVIASNTGGVAEQIEDGKNGILFTRGSKESFNIALDCILKNPELIKKYGREARKVAIEKFSLKGMIEKYNKLYGEIKK